MLNELAIYVDSYVFYDKRTNKEVLLFLIFDY